MYVCWGIYNICGPGVLRRMLSKKGHILVRDKVKYVGRRAAVEEQLTLLPYLGRDNRLIGLCCFQRRKVASKSVQLKMELTELTSRNSRELGRVRKLLNKPVNNPSSLGRWLGNANKTTLCQKKPLWENRAE